MNDWSRAASARPTAGAATPAATFSGNRGLQIEEPLIFEQDSPGIAASTCPSRRRSPPASAGSNGKGPIGLPGLSEPQVVRHFTRLSQKNYAIDSGLYPLGSCTMKHNPRLNEKLARLPGLADIHPLQPLSTVQGALELIDTLAHWLKTLTGMPAVAMSPAAGAHGELCGMMTIRAALEARGEPRRRVLVPESAHGTNPATAAACGYAVDPIPANARGRVDLAALEARLGPDVAAMMLTNPNTCGLFEDEIVEIAAAVHRGRRVLLLRRRQFQRDRRPGAAGRSRHRLHAYQPAQDVFDPAWRRRAGQRPGGAWPRASRPLRRCRGWCMARTGSGWSSTSAAQAAGGDRPAQGVSRPDGHVRARARLHDEPRRRRAAAGRRGCGAQRQLSARAARRRCSACRSRARACTRCCSTTAFLKDTGVTTLDFAKALIDEGYHPMTMYFPLVVHGALLIEPTETESKAALDQFAAVRQGLGRRAPAPATPTASAPPRVLTPRRRLDETSAARKPVLRWRPVAPRREAAE